MDNLSPDRLHEFNFISVFFKILLAFLLFAILGLFVLKINDSVRLVRGELISQVAQKDYKAAFEAIPIKVWVREGQSVSVGDTLAMFRNLDVDHALELKQSESKMENALLETGQNRRTNISKQIQMLREQTLKIDQQYERERLSMTKHLESKKTLLSLLEQKSQLAEEGLERDQLLFQDQLISKEVLQKSQTHFLNEQEKYLRGKEEQAALQNQLESLQRIYNNQHHDLTLQIEQLEGLAHQLQEQDIERNNRFQQADQNIDFYKKKQEKLYLIADIDGIVNFAFDIQKQANYVAKDERLFSIAPPNDAFIVKAYVDERKIKYLAEGQTANLKLDAYDHYQHGILEGVVQYIPERRQEERFYILIALQENDRNFELKSGYTLRGEVILEQIRLYQYITKKIFESVDGNLS